MKAKVKSVVTTFLALCLLLGLLPAAAVPIEAASLTEPITNGGFEAGTEGWTASADGTISAVTDTIEEENTVSEGYYAAQLSSNSNMYIWRRYDVTPNTTYTVSYDFKGALAPANCAVYVYNASAGNTAITNYAKQNSGDTWESVSFNLNIPEGCSKIEIWLRLIGMNGTETATVYYDNLSIVATNDETNTNIAINGGFENGTDGWTATVPANFSIIGEQITTEGNYAAQISASSPMYIYRNYDVTPGTAYKVSFDYKGALSPATCAVYVCNASANNAYISTPAYNNSRTGWESKSFEFTAPEGCSKIQIWLRLIGLNNTTNPNGDIHTVYFDNLSIVETGTTDNIAANGGFENKSDGWTANKATGFTVIGEDGSVKEGTKALRLSHNTDASVTQNGIPMMEETNYVLSYWVKGATDNTKVGAKLMSTDGQTTIYAGESFGNSGIDWEEKTLSFRTAAGISEATLTLEMNGGGTVYFDNVTLESPSLKHESYTILGNGNFNAGKICWGPYYSGGIFEVVEDTTSPENSPVAKVAGTATTSAALTQTVPTVAGGNYTLTFAAKSPDFQTGSVTLEFLDENQTKLAENGRIDPSFTPVSNEWQYYTINFTVPEGTSNLRLTIRYPELGAGTLYLDDIYLEGPLTDGQQKEANGTPVDEVEEKAPVAGQSNIIFNGSYETLNASSGTPEGIDATANAQWGTEVNLVTGGARDGSNCIRIIHDGVPNANGSIPAKGYRHVVDQEDGLVPGATYQLTYWYKSNSNQLVFKIEQHNDDITFPDSEHTYVQSVAQTRSVVWKKGEMTFTVPYVTEFLEIFVRNYGLGTTYVDDIQLVMVEEPKFAESVTTDRVFYYEDTLSGTATANLYQTMATGEYTASFKLLNAATGEVLQNSGEQQIAFTDGKATWQYDLSTLAKNTKYTVEATVTKTDGRVEMVTQNIYRYDRPTYISEEGYYTIDGTNPYTIQMGYHFFKISVGYPEAAAALGITAVQAPYSTDLDYLQNYLDTCGAAGLKVGIPLYAKKKPAAAPENLATTIAIVDRFKDHPALLGWMVQDEPFGDSKDKDHRNTELLLEESYRIIRERDEKHPIILCECEIDKYSVTVKYCDMLFVDPYPDYKYSFLSYAGDTGKIAVEAATPDNKPVINVLQTFTWNQGSKPQTGEVRHMMYQAYLNEQAGIGFFTYPAEFEGDVGRYENLADPVCPWNAEIKSFNASERAIVEKHFVANASPAFASYKDEKIQYESWMDGEKMYIALLNRTKDEQTVSMALLSRDGTMRVTGEATVLAGSDTIVPTITDDEVTLNLTGSEALLICLNNAQLVPVSTPVMVTYDLNGKEGTAPEAVDTMSGEKITAPEDPVCEGYLFDGWYLENTCTTKWDFSNNTVSVDMTLYAKWTENVEYKLGSKDEGGIKLNAAQVQEVSIEGIGELAAGEDYTYDPERGVLRFTEAFLEEKNNGGLEPGEYIVTLTYDNTTTRVMLKIEAEHLSIFADKSDLNFQKGDETGAKLYCSGVFARFRGIKKDGAEVSAEYYIVEKGSTVITFTKAYMESLSEGEHTFELVFRDGSIPAKVVITAAEENMNSGNATGTDTPSDSKEPSGSGEPADSDAEDTSAEKNTETSVDASKSEAVGSAATETGDSTQPVLWLVLAMLATIAGVVILTDKRNRR